MRLVKAGLLLALAAFLASCASTASKTPVEQPYQPNYQYSVNPASEKIDVTVGIIAPQFSGGGVEYWKRAKEDADAGEAIRALRSSFESLLTSKGFNTAGPYESLDDMTFPEKKGCDFVFYPELDLDGKYVISNLRDEEQTSLAGALLGGSNILTVCDATVRLSGSVQIVAREPLSNEKMWVKRLSLTSAPQTFRASGAACGGTAVTREINNAWKKMHEAMYQEVMRGLDQYVSAEEFQMLKRQAAELRAKKTY